MGIKHIPASMLYVCDRCGHETSKPNDRGGNSDLRLAQTAVSFNGDVGGATTNHWLCGYCTKDLTNFLNAFRNAEKEVER